MEKLLQEHFGVEWKTQDNVKFYKDVLLKTGHEENTEDAEDEKVPPVQVSEFSV